MPSVAADGSPSLSLVDVRTGAVRASSPLADGQIPYAAFPGKAAVFLQQLAVKCRDASVSRQAALAEFHAVSGLAVTLLDGRARL